MERTTYRCETPLQPLILGLLVAGASSSSTSSSSNGSFHASTLLPSSSVSNIPGSGLIPGDLLGTRSRPKKDAGGLGGPSSSAGSSGQSGLPTGSGACSPGPSLLAVTGVSLRMTGVGASSAPSRFKPPTRKGLLNASISEVTLVAPRPLTVDRTLLDCFEMFAKDCRLENEVRRSEERYPPRIGKRGYLHPSCSPSSHSS